MSKLENFPSCVHRLKTPFKMTLLESYSIIHKWEFVSIHAYVFNVICVVGSLVFCQSQIKTTTKPSEPLNCFPEEQLRQDCREATIFQEHVRKERIMSAAQLISSLPGCVQPKVSGDYVLFSSTVIIADTTNICDSNEDTIHPQQLCSLLEDWNKWNQVWINIICEFMMFIHKTSLISN